MDLDGDGHDDVISGSYWPGDLFWFRGEGKGQYAAGQKLKDVSGADLNSGGKWKSENEPDMDSLAAAPYAADMDGDGDFDLLVGNIAGRVILIPNEGTAKEPKFTGAHRRALQAGGEDLRVEGDAGPTMADWDGDGLADLIVGGGNGAVNLYRNEGTAKAPKFLKAVALVSVGGGHGVVAHGNQPTGPGMRSKACVTDYDDDGILDLLVGDFASVSLPEPVLDDAQKAKKAELEAAQAKVMEEYQKLAEEHLAPDDPKMQAMSEKLSKIYQDLRPLQAGQEMHGWVWFFRGKPAPKTVQR